MSVSENEIKIHQTLMQAPVRVKGESLQRNIEDPYIYIPQILANISSIYNSSVSKKPEGRTAELGANNWRLRIATIGELPLALFELPLEKRGRLDITTPRFNFWCLTYFGPIKSKNILVIKIDPKKVSQNFYTSEIIIARPDVDSPDTIFFKIDNVQHTIEIAEFIGDFIFATNDIISNAKKNDTDPIKATVFNDFRKYFS